VIGHNTNVTIQNIQFKNINGGHFIAKRMIGYLSHYQYPALEEIADEMLAILNDRNRIMQVRGGHTIYCATASFGFCEDYSLEKRLFLLNWKKNIEINYWVWYNKQ